MSAYLQRQTNTQNCTMTRKILIVTLTRCHWVNFGFKAMVKKNQIYLKHFDLIKSFVESRRCYLKNASCVAHALDKRIKNLKIIKKCVFQKSLTI